MPASSGIDRFQGPEGVHWIVERDFAPHLREEVLPGLAELMAGQRGRIVKSSLYRTVVFFHCGELGVYLKAHRLATLGLRIKARLWSSRARNEWDKTRALAALGIRVPRPLALGEFRAGWGRAGSYYLCQEVSQARTLTATLASPATPPRVRRELVSRVASDLGRVHRARIHHRDFHANNILVTDETTPYFIDLHSLWQVPLLWRSQRMRTLAKFLSSLDGILSRSEALRFVKNYLAGASADGQRGASGLHEWMRGVQRRSARIGQRHTASRTERCFTNSSKFRRERSLSRRSYRRREVPAERLAEVLSADRAAPDVEILKEAPRSSVWKIASPAGALVVKSYQREGLKGLARFLLGRSRAEKAWRAAHGLAVRGVRVPEHLGCVAKLGGPDLLASRFIADSLPLDRFARERAQGISGARRRALIEALAELVGTAHRRGADHTDLSAKNVLVVEGPGGWTPHLVDLECVRFRRRLDGDRIVRALGQLNDLPRQRVSRGDRLRFLRHYERSLGREVGRHRIAAIDEWTRRRVLRRERRWIAEGAQIAESAYYEPQAPSEEPGTA